MLVTFDKNGNVVDSQGVSDEHLGKDSNNISNDSSNDIKKNEDNDCSQPLELRKEVPEQKPKSYKEFADEVSISVNNCEILDKDLEFNVDLMTLSTATGKYKKLKYKSEAKRGYLGIVKHDAEFGFVFHIARFGGRMLK